MELEETLTFINIMVVYSVMIVSIILNNINHSNKNLSRSLKLHMVNTLLNTIKKPKINLSIMLAMVVGEIFMLLQTKVVTVILIDGETKLDSSLETVSEDLIDFYK
jgi:hypothetical protein